MTNSTGNANQSNSMRVNGFTSRDISLHRPTSGISGDRHRRVLGKIFRWARQRRRRGLVLGWGLLASAVLSGQSPSGAPAAPNPISTDRPAFTNSSVVVPAGRLQLENGFWETSSLGQRSSDFPETLVRFGLCAKTELRFTAPEYEQNFKTGTGFGSGPAAWACLVGSTVFHFVRT